RFANGMALLLELVVVLLLPLLRPLLVVEFEVEEELLLLPVLGFCTTLRPGRGGEVTGVFNPGEATAAVILRLMTLLASITRMSTTTSARGLSRSAMIFSASAIRSASPRAMIAFCELYTNRRWISATERTAVTISCSSCGVITLFR